MQTTCWCWWHWTCDCCCRCHCTLHTNQMNVFNRIFMLKIAERIKNYSFIYYPLLSWVNMEAYDLLLSQQNKKKAGKENLEKTSDFFFFFYNQQEKKKLSPSYLNKIKNWKFSYPINLFLEFYFYFSFCLSCLTNIDLLFSYQKKKTKRILRYNKQKENREETQVIATKRKEEKKNENEAQTSQCRSFT